MKTTIINGATLHSLMLDSMDDYEIAKTLGCEVHEMEHGPVAAVPAGWYEVSWGDHLLRHEFNSDADYRGFVATNAKELTDEQMSLVYHADHKKASRERVGK